MQSAFKVVVALLMSVVVVDALADLTSVIAIRLPVPELAQLLWF